jgi:hypothetical protein
MQHDGYGYGGLCKRGQFLRGLAQRNSEMDLHDRSIFRPLHQPLARVHAQLRLTPRNLTYREILSALSRLMTGVGCSFRCHWTMIVVA